MLLPLEFDEERHIYTTPGRYVLGTSDILELNGLINYDAVPKSVLEHAAWRGKELHKAVELYHLGKLDDSTVHGEIEAQFNSYLRWKKKSGFEIIGKPEFRFVVDIGLEIAVGGTCDLRGILDGHPTIIDLKTCSKSYGVAKEQKHLRYRMQLASYERATSCDEEWWDEYLFEHEEYTTMSRVIVELYKDGTHKQINFDEDESKLWESYVRVAESKLKAGYTPIRR